MTWLEKFYADNPSRLGASPHSIGCPTDYYARTDCPKETDGSTMTCVRCWNREMPEIPEEKEKAKAKKTSGRKKQTAFEKAVNSTANTIGREIGKKIVRGIFGSFFK